MRVAVVLLHFLLLATAAIADESEKWYRDGRPVSEEDMPRNMGLIDGFGAQLALTTDESFFERWAMPGGVPSITPVNRVSKGVLVYAVTFFTNPGMENGYARLTGSYKVFRPDGSMYAEHDNLPVLPNNFQFIEDYIYLSVAKLGITFEPQDQSGTYKVLSIIRDEVKDAELVLVSDIVVDQ
ncbi:MAG: hypothetical protein PVG89_18270 [Gammaproteobacteria bacterium]|jgi:hypothetical protein